ncbi:MAG: AAA family ATPase [Vulcanimicrobiota bacterium]
MKFNRLIINGYGKFDGSLPIEQKTFEFLEKGINVVVGSNEQGKSTIMHALVHTLFGMNKSQKELKKPWLPTREYSAELFFEVNHSFYKIFRNFETNEAELYKLGHDENELIFRGKTYPQSGKNSKSNREFHRLLAKLGIPPYDVVEQLAFIRNFEMETGISDEIRQLITGGKSNYSKVLEQLRKDYFKITRQDPWQSRNKTKDRKLETLIQDREALRENLQKSLETRSEVIVAEKESLKLNKEIVKLETELDLLQKNKDALQKLIKTQRELTQVQQKLGIDIEERNRLLKKEIELEKTNSIIIENFNFFKTYEGEILPLCKKLSSLKERRKEVEKWLKERNLKIDKLELEKKELEAEIEEKFSNIVSLPDDFPSELAHIENLQEKLKNLTHYFNEKSLIIEDLKKQVEEYDFENTNKDFEKKLFLLIGETRQSDLEIERIKALIRERENLLKTIEQTREALKEKYPGYENLPGNTGQIIQNYLSGKQEKNQKETALREKKEEFDKIEQRINQPGNYLLPGLFIILGMLSIMYAGTLFSLPSGLLYATGLILITTGAMLTYLKLNPILEKKEKITKQLEEIRTQLNQKIQGQDIIEQYFADFDASEYLSVWEEYHNAKRNLERLEIRLSTLEPPKQMNHKIENLRTKLAELRQKIGLTLDNDPVEMLEKFRQYQKTNEKLEREFSLLQEKFPSINERKLPSLCKEIKEIQETINEFFNRYSNLKGLNLAKIRVDFDSMKEIKESVRQLQHTIDKELASKDLFAEIEELSLEEKQLLERMPQVASHIGTDPDLIEEKYQEFSDLQHKTMVIRNTLAEFKNTTDIKKNIQELAARGEILNATKNSILDANPALTQLDLSNIDDLITKQEEWSRKISNLTGELTAKQDELKYYQLKIEHFVLPYQDPHIINEKIEYMNEEIEKLEKTAQAYQQAVDLLEEAVSDFQKKHRKEIENDISRVFDFFTKNKYGGINLDTDFNISVMGKQDNRIDKAALSEGTRDQLFFSARLALLQRFSSTTSLPLLLDDPFIYFDKNRLAIAQEVLEEITHSHQIILFSHDETYKNWGDLIYDLNKKMET